MAQQLITLLGGSGETDKEKRYQKTKYHFADTVSEPCEYFGYALIQQLKPDSVLILGTSGSMWDLLFETFGLTQSQQQLYEQTYNAVYEKKVSQEMLNTLQQVIQNAINTNVKLRIIPHGLQPEEQHQILATMAADINSGDTVSIDVTHGLRHLPMLAQMSALYIAKVKKATVAGVYYAAFDLSVDGVTPVIDLSGLLDIADWINAVSGFNVDSDYSIFSPLIKPADSKLANLLEEAAFNERNLRYQQSGKNLRRIPALLDEKPLTGVGALFEDEIRRRTNWHIGMGDYAQQRQLSLTYFASRDYLRAVLYAFEAFITRLQTQQPTYSRKEAKEFFEQDTNPRTNPDYKAYKRLRTMRNMIAHGDQSTGQSTLDIASEPGVRSTLADLIKLLLPEQTSRRTRDKT